MGEALVVGSAGVVVCGWVWCWLEQGGLVTEGVLGSRFWVWWWEGLRHLTGLQCQPARVVWVLTVVCVAGGGCGVVMLVGVGVKVVGGGC